MIVSVVVPVYNSAATLAELTAKLGEVLPKTCAQFEVVLVNDGSRDASWGTITRLARDHEWVRGIDLMRNYGQHNALLAGIRAARYEFIVTLDDDLQNPPDEIPRLLAKLAEGYDVVYGTPQLQTHGLGRNLASRLTRLALQSAMGVEHASSASAFRAFRSELREAFANYSSPFVSIDVLLTWGTSNFGSVAVRQNPRRAGRSGYGLRRLVGHAIDMITSFSAVPLRLASLIGFLLTLVGIAVLIYIVALYFVTGESLSVFRFLFGIIAIFSGAQLFALGIIGEYLARMHFRMMAQPAYTVRAHTERVTQTGMVEDV